MARDTLYLYITQAEGRELISVLEMTMRTLDQIAGDPDSPIAQQAHERLKLQAAIYNRLKTARPLPKGIETHDLPENDA